jgi:RHH-type proline utilization regulon transcriptional repressor/proline dehydrogenase/delta 1-pyrroline-5-carboxylate dehydrogenase
MNMRISDDLEQRILESGKACFEEIRSIRPSLLDTKAYTNRLMEWAMKDPEFRIALFRFVDVLPGLKDSQSVIEHAQAYFRPVAERIPGILQWGLDLDPGSIRAKAAAALIRRQVASLGQQFIIGESPGKALKALRKLHAKGLSTTVDLLGEACVSEQEAQTYTRRYMDLIDELSGEVPVNVSVKLSALDAHLKPVAFAECGERLGDTLRILFRKAQEKGAFVYVDMEDTSKTDLTLKIVRDLLMEDEFRTWSNVGIVLQAYLRRTPQDLDDLIDWLTERGTPIAVRLVKGAYWDTESILARLASWPVPVWLEKETSDLVYEELSRVLIDHAELVRPAFASHNLRSLIHAMEYAREKGLSAEDYEFQTLYGMADPIKEVFVRRGVTVREYAPIGDILTGMSYFVRRLLENTANEGFIRTGYMEGESVEVLMRAPESGAIDPGISHLKEDKKGEFINAPLSDFTIKENREVIRAAIDQLNDRRNGDFPRVFPIIGGDPVKDCVEYQQSDCPEDTEFVLGTAGMAENRHLEMAIQSVQSGFQEWRSASWAERCGLLLRVAALMEQEHAALSALIILECGKPWVEADAEVAEAIDFCRYYASQALEMGNELDCCPMDGEEDHYFYEPRGVCAVIGPWNFPLAIPCGMMSAALVTGNTVILKPAEQSNLVAARLFDLFLEAGMPANAAAFLPGDGQTIGARLVDSEHVATIAFTGSREVGMQIIQNASVTHPGQVHVKRVVAEMGGKNAIVVDDGADLDQAVQGIIYSAFGYAGQKCSACSRLYVHQSIYERLLERLQEAVKSQVTGPASDPSVDLGPVIDDDACERIKLAIEESSHPCVQGRLKEGLPKGRYFPATLFHDVPFEDPLMRNELFGPVLAMAPVESFQEAIDRANDSHYGLTGGVFSRHPAHLKLAARTFRVGNLYLNRGCTGALVGRQPFGGARHSGVGSKAGGPDYLKQFVIPRLVCENTIRHGFAPMSGD